MTDLMARRHRLEPGVVEVAAEDIRRDDVFDFAGANLRAATITYFDDLVEIEAVGPFGITTIHFLKFEAVKVFLPRAELPP